MNEIVTTNIIGLIHWWGGRASLINSKCKNLSHYDCRTCQIAMIKVHSITVSKKLE